MFVKENNSAHLNEGLVCSMLVENAYFAFVLVHVFAIKGYIKNKNLVLKKIP